MRLAGHPVDAQAVGPVRRDLQLQHVVGDRQYIQQRGAGGQAVLVQDQDPGVLGADAQFVLGQDHPLRDHAAQLGGVQPAAVGQDRARARHRHRLAGGDVGRATHDLGDVDLAHRDPAHRQAVGVGMALGLQHLPDHEGVERGDAVAQHPLDLGAGHVEALGQLGGIERGAAVIVQPADGHSHPNCSRKRTSLS